MEPDNLAVYVRRAEKEVLPIIKEMHLGPGAAQFLLAQQTQVLVTGDPRITIESGMAIATSVLALWQKGYYTPSPAYPYTLEETLQELQEGPQAKENYKACFQPFVLRTGRGHAASAKWPGGLCNIPQTKLWQIWMMIDGPATFIAAYRDPAKAHRNLETIISASRREDPRRRPHCSINGCGRRQTGSRSSFLMI